MAKELVKDNAMIVEVKKQCIKEICQDADCLYVLGTIALGVGIGVGAAGITIGATLISRVISKEKKFA